MIVPLFPLKEFIPMPLFTTYVKEGQRTNNGRLEVYSSSMYMQLAVSKLKLDLFSLRFFSQRTKCGRFLSMYYLLLPTYIYTAMQWQKHCSSISGSTQHFRAEGHKTCKSLWLRLQLFFISNYLKPRPQGAKLAPSIPFLCT